MRDSDKSRLREHLVFLHTWYTHTHPPHRRVTLRFLSSENIRLGRRGWPWASLSPCFCCPWTPPGSVWPWILALPEGSTEDSVSQSSQATRKQSLCSRSGEHRTARGEVLLGGPGGSLLGPCLPPLALPTSQKDISGYNLFLSCPFALLPPPLGFELFFSWLLGGHTFLIFLCPHWRPLLSLLAASSSSFSSMSPISKWWWTSIPSSALSSSLIPLLLSPGDTLSLCGFTCHLHANSRSFYWASLSEILT